MGLRREYGLASLALAVAAGGLACDPAFLADFRSRFRAQLATPDEGQVCGNRSEIAAIIQDCPMEGACFTSACEAHDLCYANCTISRSECDQHFRDDMRRACHDQIALADPNFLECIYLANLYWAAVELYGEKYYVCDGVPPPGPQPGACCGTETCLDVASQSECPFNSVFINGLTCAEVDQRVGGCPLPPNDDCPDALRVCAGQAAGVGLGFCSSTDDNGRMCSVSSQDCVLGDACLPHDGDAYRCIIPADTRLSTTDGPAPGDTCEPDESDVFQADVWYEYIAPCNGTLSIQMCSGTFYDSMLAVYGTGDSTASCVCPEDNETILACDDDGCGGFGNPSVATSPVVEGACYLIRVGGWSSNGEASGAERGISRLDIGVLCE